VLDEVRDDAKTDSGGATSYDEDLIIYQIPQFKKRVQKYYYLARKIGDVFIGVKDVGCKERCHFLFSQFCELNNGAETIKE
jgi:hypothetical protein